MRTGCRGGGHYRNASPQVAHRSASGYIFKPTPRRVV